MVFDFIDNANLFNMPHSIHRLLNLKDYRPGQLVLAPKKQIELDRFAGKRRKTRGIPGFPGGCD